MTCSPTRLKGMGLSFCGCYAIRLSSLLFWRYCTIQKSPLPETGLNYNIDFTDVKFFHFGTQKPMKMSYFGSFFPKIFEQQAGLPA